MRTRPHCVEDANFPGFPIFSSITIVVPDEDKENLVVSSRQSPTDDIFPAVGWSVGDVYRVYVEGTNARVAAQAYISPTA